MVFRSNFESHVDVLSPAKGHPVVGQTGYISSRMLGHPGPGLADRGETASSITRLPIAMIREMQAEADMSNDLDVEPLSEVRAIPGVL
jgi:hypothetical protein